MNIFDHPAVVAAIVAGGLFMAVMIFATIEDAIRHRN